MTLSQRYPISDLVTKFRKKYGKSKEPRFTVEELNAICKKCHPKNEEPDSIDDLFKSGNIVQIEIRGDQSAVIMALDTLQDMRYCSNIEWRFLKK